MDSASQKNSLDERIATDTRWPALQRQDQRQKESLDEQKDCGVEDINGPVMYTECLDE